MTAWILFGVTALLSYLVQGLLTSRFEKYSKIPTETGVTGADVARMMLRDHGITDVQVGCVSGTLTDHYNPVTKTLNLSQGVYYSDSVAAAAVAAHECGHAVQHAREYLWLGLRSKLVPVVSFASRFVQWVLLAGMLLINVFPQLLWVGIALFALTTLFSIVTLPVEVNASSRALEWLESVRITGSGTHVYAKKALASAAYTYFVAAISSLATLVYYIMVAESRR